MWCWWDFAWSSWLTLFNGSFRGHLCFQGALPFTETKPTNLETTMQNVSREEFGAGCLFCALLSVPDCEVFAGAWQVPCKINSPFSQLSWLWLDFVLVLVHSLIKLSGAYWKHTVMELGPVCLREWHAKSILGASLLKWEVSCSHWQLIWPHIARVFPSLFFDLAQTGYFRGFLLFLSFQRIVRAQNSTEIKITSIYLMLCSI